MIQNYAAATMASTPPSPGLPRVATAIAVAAWGIALLAVGFVTVSRPPVDTDFWFFAVDAMVAVVYGTAGAVTLSRRVHPVPLILAVTAVGGGLASLGYAWKVLELKYGGLPELAGVLKLSNTAWVPGTLALFLVIPWLIRDHRLGLEWIGVLGGSAIALYMTWERIFLDGRDDHLMFQLTVVYGIVTALVVAARWVAGPVEERRGLGWLTLGTLVMALSFVPLVLAVGAEYDAVKKIVTVDVLGLTLNFEHVINGTPALHLAAQALFPAAILVAVLRGRMWGLDLAISRTTLAGLLTLVLVILYLLVSLLVEKIIPGEGFAHLVAAGTVAVAVQPARLWFSVRVNKLVYGDAATDPAHLVRTLGSRLGVVADTDELFAGLARDLGRSMRLESVAVRAPGVDVRWGRPTSEPTSLPLRHQGEQVGTVEVTAPAGESLGERGAQLVSDFGSVAAAALAVRQQAAEVEDARARLTRARLEERRVIRREIHDGLGPSLAGLRLGLQGARNLLGRDDAAAAKILEQLQADLDQRVDEVRTLSHSLLPPVIDELGLAPALQELAARHADTGLTVQARADLPAGLPTPIAAAAYAIASEALINTARHSGAENAGVDARVEADRLVVTVQDDGSGVAADAVAGVGTRSMSERAEELGGSVTTEARPGGGTVVRAELPLEVDRV
ncbi:signal transduction histidine kinase [Marmoricola sp. OAE513]|uniref:sensor histidine kinase n=1 Tax=Marmoricola sp. OAE513 TaxID=2817894 RepID=UPI001AEA8534